MGTGERQKQIIITEVTIRKSQFNLAFYIALCLDSLHRFPETIVNLVSFTARVVRGVDPEPAPQLLLGVARAAFLPVLNISQPVSVTSQSQTETPQLSPS